MTTPEIRGLAVRQPFAWAICANVKKVENRSWTTNYRGTVVIHASTGRENVRDFLSYAENLQIKPDWFPYGAIIGFADLVDVRVYGPEFEQDPFASGPFCWIFENGRFLNSPIPFSGKLNLFKIPADLQLTLREADTHVVDTGNKSAIEGSVAEMLIGEPDPVLNYCLCVDDFEFKAYPTELLISCGERLTALAPSEPKGWFARAFISYLKGEYSEAVVDLERYERCGGDSPNAWLYLTSSLTLLGDYQRALVAAEKLVQMAPDAACVYEHRGRAFYWLQRLEDCIADCSKAIELEPNLAVAWAMRAEAKRDLSRLQDALPDINRAIELEPSSEYYQEIRKSIVQQA